MITFHPDFKKNTKNLFLSLSNFINTNILMYEHLSSNSPCGQLQSENSLITYLNTRLEDTIVRVDEIYHAFQEEFFAVLSEEVDPVFPDEQEGDSPLKILGVTPLIPTNLEKVKLDFDEELELLKQQYSSILAKKYEDLNNDSLFNDKLQEFCSIVKPDSDFFQDIKKKELWLLDSAKVDFENAPTVESVEVGKKNSRMVNAVDFQVKVQKAKSIEIHSDGRFELSDDDEFKIQPKKNYEGVKTPKKTTMDDMNLGTKSKGLGAADFSGTGSGGGIEQADIFQILSFPDCTPFYMTGLHGCKILFQRSFSN